MGTMKLYYSKIKLIINLMLKVGVLKLKPECRYKWANDIIKFLALAC